MPAAFLFVLLLAVPSFAQGVLLERGAEGQSSSLKLLSERVSVRIDHQYAETVLDQQFENLSDQRVEGRYLLRTAGATVEGFAYWNGEQKIVGEVFEKQSARALYDDLVGKRRDPGLLEQVGEGSFAFNVFPIEPRERKRVQVRFGQRLSRAGPLMRYRLTLGGGESQVIAEIADEHPIRRIDSPSHALDVSWVDPRHARVLASAGAFGSRDLLLDVEVAADPWQPGVLVHRDAGQDAYLVLQMAAPRAIEQADVSAKDVTVVIDRSGSMTGAPLEQARAAAELVVRRLREGDRVNVIAFDDKVDRLFREPLPVERSREDALRFIGRVRAGGGTDIAAALSAALASQNGGHQPHIVLFLTDGQSDSASALRVARDDPGDARVFTLGLGPGVEKPLLSRLSAMKRGRFTYVESPEAIEQRVGRLFDQIESPALVGLTLESRGAALSRVYPRTLPDLCAGDDLLIAARVSGAPGATVELLVHGTLGGRQVAYPVSLTLPETAAHPWVGRVWAKARIDDALEEMALTRAPPQELRDEVVELGIAYGLVTPWTSFLAVPESEMTAGQAATLAELREQRRAVLAANSDAAALSRTVMPPGDPVLTVAAPKDALQVTAYLPFGLVKDLHWDARLEKWTLRFLVPVGVADGEYQAQVVIVKRDHTVELAKATYVIDSRAPEFEVVATRTRTGTHVRVVAAEPARKVTVALAAHPRSRVVLRGDGRVFEGVLRQPGRLRVVVADAARNESAREVIPR
ncbi:MAG TPA: VIT and VWA domain-containing protein [Myxococcales bacterium]|nr:VIT and VWA domain-containing protein [Myxococcales bacterium]